MIVHLRSFAGGIFCTPATTNGRANVISSPNAERVNCRDCLKRYFGEGGTSTGAAREAPDAPQQAVGGFNRVARGFARA